MREAVVACVLLLGSSVLVPGVFGQPSVDAQGYVDVLFTDVSHVEDVMPWGEDGHVLATRGGLVVSAGDGVREIITASDGLPSNVVWSLAQTDEGLLVGTEGGAAIVDLSDLSVEEIDAPPEAQGAVTGFVKTVEVTDEGDWWIHERGGNVSVRAADGTWRAYPELPEERSHHLIVEDGRVLATVETPPTEDTDAGIVELTPNGTWEEIHDTGPVPIKLALHGETLLAGMRSAGVFAFEDGERVDLGAPESLGDKTVLSLTSHEDVAWVGTDDGLYRYEASAGNWSAYDENQLPYTSIEAVQPLDVDATDPLAGVMLGTSEGLVVPEGDPARSWELHATMNGPNSNQFLSLESRNGTDIWGGTQDGVDIFFPGIRLWNHWEQSEISQGLRSEKIHAIEHEDNHTWFATDYGVYQLNWTSGDWRILIDQSPDKPPGNTFYDIKVDGDQVWMPEWGAGLLHHYVDTNTTYDYQIEDGLLSHGLMCVDRWQEFLAVCETEAFQLFNLSRASAKHPIGLPYDECNNYACNYTAPMNFTFDALPDGQRIWVASAHAGLVSLTRDDQKGIAVEKQFTVEDGMPSNEVRSLERAADGVWAGTTNGLAHVNMSEGVTQTWTTEGAIGQSSINAIEPLGDVLYLGTYSGLYRLDLETRELLDLHEGAESLSTLPGQITVTFPERGARLAGDVDMTGKAQLPGGTIDRVEVRLDNGTWTSAQGREDWRFHLPVSSLETGAHEADIRVVSNGTDVANTTFPFRVVPSSGSDGEGIYFDHVPPRRAGPGDRILVTADVGAPEPVDVSIEAKVAGETLTPRGRMSGSTASFVLDVPEDATGEIRYTFTVRSGAGTDHFPPEGTYTIPVELTEGRGFLLEIGDPTIRLTAGESATRNLTLRNTGGAVEELETELSGLRSSWASLDAPQTLTVPPDRERTATLEISVPDDAHPLTTVLGVRATSADQALTQTRTLTLEVEPSGGETFSGGAADAPAPAVAWLTLSMVAAALALRRTREVDR